MRVSLEYTTNGSPVESRKKDCGQNEKWVPITDVMTDTHFILKWISKPLKCTSSFFSFFCIQFFPILFLYLLFLYFDLIDLCMLPLFVLCSGFSVASSRFSLESWLTILKMYIWLFRLLRTLLLWKSASFQTLLAPDWSGFSRNSLGSELSKIFCSEDIFAFQTLSFFGRWISVFLRWGVVRLAFRLKLFCCSWDAAFWNFIRADRFPVWS